MTKIQTREFIAQLASLMALVALSINTILPAFSEMMREFGLSRASIAGLTVSLLYVGLSFGQIVFGAASDSIGRKPAMLIGLGVFAAGSLLSSQAPTFAILVVGQIVQGFGLGAPRVIPVAIIRDKFEGPGMARIMSFVMVVFSLVPTASPYFGQVVIASAGWRMLFIVIVAIAALVALWLALRLPESHPRSNRNSLSFRAIATNIWMVFTNRSAILHTTALGSVTGAFIAYLNLSQQIFQSQYGLGTQYPLYFALISSSLALASWINGKAVVTLGLEWITSFALICIMLISGLLYAGVIVTDEDPTLFILLAYMMAMLFGFGVLVSNLNTLAMRSLGDVAGAGAAFVGASATLISAPLAILVANAYSGSVLPLVIAFGVFAAIGLCLVHLSKY
jgi:DHA1 family bicyclomycin/chloramphenicol resistance-like MFS transporter